jgi:hypothetical protein
MEGNMQKKLSVILSCLLLIISTLQACTLPNKPYVKKDTAPVPSLKVARYETSAFRTYQVGNMISIIVVSGVLFGGIGAGIGYAIHRGVSQESDDPQRPNFGKMVMDQFIERSKNEIPNWPSMIIEEKTITAPLQDRVCHILEFKVEDIKLETGSCVLIIETTITMRDIDGNVLWEKGYAYDSSAFKRTSYLDGLKADDYKLFKEEYAFAAEKTVTDFIEHFKGSPSSI